MFSSIRIVAGAAILALGGSLVLIAGPLGPSSDPIIAPGAESATDVSHEPGYFSGVTVVQSTADGTQTILDDRVQVRDAAFAFRIVVDDPRVTSMQGSSDQDWDIFTKESGELAQVLRRGTGRIENDQGAWNLAFTGAAPDLEAPGPYDGDYVFVSMIGEGGYEGLVGTFLMTDIAGTASSWQTEGWIFPEAAPLLE